MHLRSALLLACLVVVPAIAMFSHKIPREARGFLRSRLLGPIADAAADSLGMGSPPGGPGAGSGAESSSAPPLDGGSDVARTPQAGAAASTSVTPPARFAPSGDAVATVTPMFQRGASDRAAAGRAAVVGAAPDAPSGSAHLAPIPADRELLESRLRSLGATHVEWTPGQGADGVHRCSCRIPAEPSGQLHRVFQASANDPVAALDTLVGQVTAWSLRNRDTDGAPRAPLQGDRVVAP